MSTFLDIKTYGVPELVALMKRIPEFAKPAAITEATIYFVGNHAHGLKHYPPYKGQKYQRTYKLQDG